jgi:hypothetical protein
MSGSEDFLKVEQKWGFGMAPIKQEVMAKRTTQVLEVADYIDSRNSDAESLQESLSQVKGLFTRIYKQDQWDWFTVWTQLGRPGTKTSRDISELIYQLRKIVASHQKEGSEEILEALRKLGLAHFLSVFLSPRNEVETSEAVGKIYILSTRESKDVLKIGYTNRTVEERVREINSATGVLIPYGVRAMWIVKSAREVEAELHNLLAPFRVRQDREFFQMDYLDAFKFITSYIREKREEL